MNTETNTRAAELDSASLDQVVGGAVLHERRLTGDTTDLRKQEETDKLTSADAA